jgi:hypothetical protein
MLAADRAASLQEETAVDWSYHHERGACSPRTWIYPCASVPLSHSSHMRADGGCGPLGGGGGVGLAVTTVNLAAPATTHARSHRHLPQLRLVVGVFTTADDEGKGWRDAARDSWLETLRYSPYAHDVVVHFLVGAPSCYGALLQPRKAHSPRTACLFRQTYSLRGVSV